MNLINTMEEIGILKTNYCISKYISNYNIISEISRYIPIHSYMNNIDIIDHALFKIKELKKNNIFLLSNELAILERIQYYKLNFNNIIVCLSHNLLKEQIDNIKHNVPDDLNISFVNELDYPEILKPKDSVILVTGYICGNGYLIPHNTYLMLEIYKSFLGKIIFINCSKENIILKPSGWVKINNKNIFSMVL